MTVKGWRNASPSKAKRKTVYFQDTVARRLALPGAGEFAASLNPDQDLGEPIFRLFKDPGTFR